jgi:hypothetical protein
MISFLSPPTTGIPVHKSQHYNSLQQQQQQEVEEAPCCPSSPPSPKIIMKTIQLTCNNTEVNPLTVPVGKSLSSSASARLQQDPPIGNTTDNELLVLRPPSKLSSASSSGLTRTRTVHSLCASSHETSFSLSNNKEHSQTSTIASERSDSSFSTSTALPLPSPDFSTFGMDLRRYTCESPSVPVFDSAMRQVLEPHIRKARLAREEVRQQHRRMNLRVHDSIASSVGVPYVRLRSERPFLYDIYTHPMHQILAETLGVEDLSRLHNHLINSQPRGNFTSNTDTLEHIMSPLKCRASRRHFQESYDNFVTSFCIPLLHSMAMSQSLFHGVRSTGQNTRISYRYQAFPNIRVVRPGDATEGPRCDTSKGHNVAFLHFHVPLTPSYGTNALYTESHPGKEDWHPLQTKSTGLGFLFDGGRCLHFNMENTTQSTLVALDFLVAIYYSDQHDTGHPTVDPDGLCNRSALEDLYSLSGPGYYDEALIDIRPDSPFWQCVAKKPFDRKYKKLLDPDARNGFPFA